jgi:hypothetical protein
LRTEPVPPLRSVAPERADVARAGTAELGEVSALVGGRLVLSGDAIEEMTELRLLAFNDRG